MKLKKWWGFSALMLTGIGVIVPITLTTSCAEKKDWTFNNYHEADNYLQKHKQDVSEAYIFSSTVNQTDYEFLKKNVSLQLFVNSYLFFASMQALEIHISKIELHIKNKTTAEIDLHLTDLDLEPKLTITYDNFLLKIDFDGTTGEIEYDFKTAVSEDHYYDLALAPHTVAQYLEFYNTNNSIELTLSPYDWTNHFLLGSIEKNQ